MMAREAPITPPSTVSLRRLRRALVRKTCSLSSLTFFSSERSRTVYAPESAPPGLTGATASAGAGGAPEGDGAGPAAAGVGGAPAGAGAGLAGFAVAVAEGGVSAWACALIAPKSVTTPRARNAPPEITGRSDVMS